MTQIGRFQALQTSLCLLILVFCANAAWADHGQNSHVDYGLTVPSSSDGNFSVSWSVSYNVELQEKVDSSSYTTVYFGKNPPIAFTNKSPGTYSYRLRHSFYSKRRGEQIVRYTLPETVVVGASAGPDRTDVGFRGEYIARSGDLNGDGRGDLVIMRKSGQGGSAAPDNFALIQKWNRTFWIDDTLSANQINVAQNWPISSVDLIQRDINSDGRFDFLVKGIALDNNFSELVLDQIIYAPAQSPMRLRAVDAGLRQFFENTYGWMADKDYFEREAIENGWYEYHGNEQTGWWNISYINIYYTWGGGNNFLGAGDDPNDSTTMPSFCQSFPWQCTFSSSTGYWLVYGTFLANIEIVFDYSNFSSEARQFASAAGDAFHDVNIGAMTDAGPAEQILEGVLQAELGDYLSEVLADPMPVPELPSGDQLPVPQDSPWGDGRPANDPNFGNKKDERRKWDWRILGRVGIIVCGLLCPSDIDSNEETELEWYHFGWEWAIYDLAKSGKDKDEEEIGVIIGEGEGGGVYQRIPNAAAHWGALYYDPGLFSSGPERPENARFMWSMNQAWILFFRSAGSKFYDIGLYNNRQGDRGVFYPCERVTLGAYPNREQKWFEGTLSHNHGPCKFIFGT